MGTCVKSIAGLLGHVAKANCDTVSTARLQSLKSVLHCVVLRDDFIIALCLSHRVPQMYHICLHTATHPATHPAINILHANNQNA